MIESNFSPAETTLRPPMPSQTQVNTEVKRASELWSIVSHQVQKVLGETIWEQWFEDIIPLFIKDSTLYLQAPGKFHKLWIANNYMESLELLMSLQDDTLSVAVVLPEEKLSPCPLS